MIACSEIDEPTSTQDLEARRSRVRRIPDEVGNLDSQISTGLVKIMHPEFKRERERVKERKTNTVGRINSRKEESSDVDRKTDRFHDIRDLSDQQRPVGRYCHVGKQQSRKFDEALYHQQLDKSTSTQNALSLPFRPDSPRRAAELLDAESYGHRCIGRPAAKCL